MRRIPIPEARTPFSAVAMALPCVLTLVACGEATGTPGDDVLTGERLVVRGTAALSGCNDCAALDPTLSYQTPSALGTGVAEIALMRGATDPNPMVVFASIPAKNVDLVAGATFAAIDLGRLEPGDYTHMRVKLDWLTMTAAATAHASGYSLPGSFELDYALSDQAQPEPRAQGDYLATFHGLTPVTQAGQLEPTQPPSFPCGTVDLSDDAYRITFAMPDGPLHIDPQSPRSVDVDVTFQIENAFGWRDLEAPGHTAGVFDLDMTLAYSEPPITAAVRGFDLLVTRAE